MAGGGHVSGAHAVDHRTRAPGAGYAGGPAATTAKGPPARKGGAGHVAPVQAPTKPQPKYVYKLSLKV
jgi:hypothetical protein